MTFERIEQNPAILHGKPVIKGTRIPVSVILNYLANGANIDEILSDYPTLTRQDVLAAIEFAAAAMNYEERIFA